MKLPLISFLFFILIVLNHRDSCAQTTDSLTYYSQAITRPTQPDDLAKAYKFFTAKRLQHAGKKQQLTHEIYAIQNLARIHERLGYISESEKLHLECLELLAQIDQKNTWARTSYRSSINELGKLYRKRKDYKQSLALYDKALEAVTTPLHRAILLNNKGQVYEFNKDLKTAQSLYKTAHDQALLTSDSLEIARTLSNLSFIKTSTEPKAAEKGLLSALEIRKKVGNPFEIASSYDHLTRFYKQQKDTLKMKLFSDQFLEIAQNSKIAEQLQSALQLKVKTGEYEYAPQYIRLNDSINTLKETQRNNFNYYVYQYNKKEKDLEKSKLYNERLFYLVLFIILIALSIYFVIKHKHKREKLQEIFTTEKRISRTIHDEVANDVYHLMTQLQSGTDNHDNLLDQLEHIYTRTRDISKQNSSIDLSIPYPDLLNDLFLSYENEQVQIITKGVQSIPWDRLNKLQKSTVYRVLQELLTNMRKHSQASFVVFNFTFSKGFIDISYKDNGVGSSIKKGNGLQNTESRINSIKGSITFESEIGKGFKAIIRI